MKNVSKHSIKCNKRDKTVGGCVVYRVVSKFPSCCDSFTSKYDAFQELRFTLEFDSSAFVEKVTVERVIS